MIINSITLDNFRSHKHSVINLNEGISVILGENGAGKSSIFEAISYSFFKTFTGKIEDLFRKSADENDNINEMKVTVEFEHGITHYKLVRGKKKSSNIAKLYRKESDNLSLICEGDTVVTREIESILSLDSKSFLNAVYIRQGEITDLIEKTAAEKKELIAKLLNMDSLQKASDDFKEIIKRYEEQISKNEGTL
ncbi:MAG TPA: SMC family ATPase, partial [Methanosphaera sp.]|nr:SMC family ATPase [Methanosphaera sp.]